MLKPLVLGDFAWQKSIHVCIYLQCLYEFVGHCRNPHSRGTFLRLCAAVVVMVCHLSDLQQASGSFLYSLLSFASQRHFIDQTRWKLFTWKQREFWNTGRGTHHLWRQDRLINHYVRDAQRVMRQFSEDRLVAKGEVEAQAEPVASLKIVSIQFNKTSHGR